MLNRHNQELDQLQVIAGLDRDHVARQVAVGLAQARAGHWDLAVLTLGSALELSPNEPEIYRALGKVWLERPRDDRAFLSKARKALEPIATSPAATSAMLTLYGRALLQEGDVEGAEHALQQATVRFPVEPQAFALYGSTAEKLNHLEAARQALIQYGGLTRTQPKPPRAARIASLSLRLNDPETAVRWPEPPPRATTCACWYRSPTRKSRGRSKRRRPDCARPRKGPKNPALLLLSRRAR